MGNAKSSAKSSSPNVEKWRRVLDVLGLSAKEVHKLYRTYSFIDVDDSNSINIHELMVRLGLENSQFMTRVFSLLDMDKSGGIDFGEFVVSLWNYCTMKSEEIGSGMLQTRDLQRMIIDIYGKKLHKHRRAAKLFDKITLSQFHCYSVDSFRDFVRHHPTLLYPAFIAQQRLRSTILGKRFWRRLAKRREQNPEMVTFQHLRFLVTRCQQRDNKQSPLFVDIVDFINNDKGGVYYDTPSAFTARTMISHDTARSATSNGDSHIDDDADEDDKDSPHSIVALRDEDEIEKPAGLHHLPAFIACYDKKFKKVVPVS